MIKKKNGILGPSPLVSSPARQVRFSEHVLVTGGCLQLAIPSTGAAKQYTRRRCMCVRDTDTAVCTKTIVHLLNILYNQSKACMYVKCSKFSGHRSLTFSWWTISRACWASWAIWRPTRWIFCAYCSIQHTKQNRQSDREVPTDK